jgi:hypothetical protein
MASSCRTLVERSPRNFTELPRVADATGFNP